MPRNGTGIYFWDQRQHENSPVAFYQLNQKSQLGCQTSPSWTSGWRWPHHRSPCRSARRRWTPSPRGKASVSFKYLKRKQFPCKQRVAQAKSIEAPKGLLRTVSPLLAVKNGDKKQICATAQIWSSSAKKLKKKSCFCDKLSQTSHHQRSRLTTTTFFSPALVAFWVVVIVFPSKVTIVLQWRPSVVSSSNSSPSLKSQMAHSCQAQSCFTNLNFSSMLLTVVLVTMVQLPPSSVMVITGVEARAAFLRMKPTPRAFRKSSYFSEETWVYCPVIGAMVVMMLGWCLDVQWGAVAARSPKVDMEFTLGGDKQRSSTRSFCTLHQQQTSKSGVKPPEKFHQSEHTHLPSQCQTWTSPKQKVYSLSITKWTIEHGATVPRHDLSGQITKINSVQTISSNYHIALSFLFYSCFDKYHVCWLSRVISKCFWWLGTAHCSLDRLWQEDM